MSVLRLVDLFAGTGAFTKAFTKHPNVSCVFANDISPDAKAIYNVNFKHELVLKDLNDIPTESIPAHDILTAGFPCQPFSVAGNRKGFNDPRSNVFWKIIDIIRHHKPLCVVLENVKNLITHDNKNTFKIIKDNLEQSGYTLIYKVLNTSEITTIPQHRERIYVICIRKDSSISNKFTLDYPLVKKSSVNSMLLPKVPSKYYYGPTTKVWPLVQATVVKPNTVYQYRRVYVRENKSGECPTLTANMGTGGHNVPIILDTRGPRKLTPRECFSLQGFPTSYVLPPLSDSKLYKLAGNAVTLSVIELIADRLIHLIRSEM